MTEFKVIGGPVPLSDDEAAERFITAYGDDVRYVPEWRSWLVWRDWYWQVDPDSAIAHQMARTVPKGIALDALERSSDEARKMFTWARKTANSGGIRSFLDVARSTPGILTSAARFDADTTILNTPSGIVNLKTGGVTPSSRDALCTLTTPTAYTSDAEAPAWHALLSLVFGDDAELHRYFRRLVGLAVSGNPGERIIPILYGAGRNGKTTLLQAILRTLGPYAHTGDGDRLLLTKHSNGADEDLAALMGKRIVVIPELPAGDLNAARVKRLSGGDDIPARKLYGHAFVFQPTHTFFVATNERPAVHDQSTAMWDRLRLIPCEREIIEPRPRGEVDAELHTQREGILNWIVAASVEYHQHALGPVPQSVTAGTDEWRDEDDQFGAYLADCCIIERGAQTTSRNLYDAYTAWSAENGHYGKTVLSMNMFGRELTKRGYKKPKKTASHYRSGIRLRGVTD